LSLSRAFWFRKSRSTCAPGYPIRVQEVGTLRVSEKFAVLDASFPSGY
jgi:hypothetical protein